LWYSRSSASAASVPAFCSTPACRSTRLKYSHPRDRSSVEPITDAWSSSWVARCSATARAAAETTAPCRTSASATRRHDGWHNTPPASRNTVSIGSRVIAG